MSVVSDKSTDDNSCPIFKDLLAVNQPVYVNAHFTSGSSSFYNKSLLDIGSDICLISHAVLLKNKLVGSMFGEGQNIIGSPILKGRSLLQERVSKVHFDWAKSEVCVFRKRGTDHR